MRVLLLYLLLERVQILFVILKEERDLVKVFLTEGLVDLELFDKEPNDFLLDLSVLTQIGLLQALQNYQPLQPYPIFQLSAPPLAAQFIFPDHLNSDVF